MWLTGGKNASERSTQSRIEHVVNDPYIKTGALWKLNNVLAKRIDSNEGVDVTVEGSDEVIHLPQDVAGLLQDILADTVAGRSVGVIPMRAELTTQQGADLLNVSRPHAIKLMNDASQPPLSAGAYQTGVRPSREIPARTPTPHTGEPTLTGVFSMPEQTYILSFNPEKLKRGTLGCGAPLHWRRIGDLNP